MDINCQGLDTTIFKRPEDQGVFIGYESADA